ncbi:site-specific DNA-methyltransferase [Leuconostoc mesenteroides]|uniref:site-specific DNA-methyltransferase n=1 Tax=Leuconostoc mesenteroides TaxID=1245 RepID=UPI000E936DAB|nr:site-specific DNA-methyltransferase [Leuconostoc mesenteroides]HAV52410.1 site-specific DNA-methyltransferase [Leuconostoc mesenteroides]
MTDTPESVNLSDVSSRKVDTELLNELRDLFARAEDQKERYDFTWNGKAKAYFEAATPTTKTLRPQPEESYIYADDDYKEKVNTFNDSENLFITGDNLEALKLLQESYLGKIDMIYIDPPYNTGKDFVYHDNFKSTQKDTDVAEGSVDEDGNRLVKNEKNSGRYHSDWLNMMYPRLKLARNLLSDSGVIFVSIDDNEQANLKLLMDEVFGEDNFVADVTRIAKRTSDKGTHFRPTKDHIIVYGKYISFLPEFGIAKLVKEADYKFTDGNGKKYKKSGASLFQPSLDSRPNQRYYIEAPDGSLIIPPGNVFPEKKVDGSKIKPESNSDKVWRWSVDSYIKQKEKLIFTKGSSTNPLLDENGNQSKWNIYPKVYFEDDLAGKLHPEDVIYDFPNSKGTKEILQLNIPFSFAKPSELIKYLGTLFDSKDRIVLDFFAGSGTTADAVMQLNKEDGGNRKFIVATLDEPVPEDSEARKAGYQTIDQISRERIRRAAKKLGDTSGFRALKVDKTGLKEDVFKTAGELTQENLQLDVDNQEDARSDYDLLYDVLVDGALEYNRQIATETISNEPIIKYDYLGELSGVIAYFGDNLTNELTREIAKLKPLIAVFKESTFNKSSDKVNVLEQFRVISPETKVKVI